MGTVIIRRDLFVAAVAALVIHVCLAATEISIIHPPRKVTSTNDRYLRISFVVPPREVAEAVPIRPVVQPVIRKQGIQKMPQPAPVEKKKEALKKERMDEIQPAEPEAVEETVSTGEPEQQVESKETAEISVVSAVPRYEENPPPIYPQIAKNRGYEGMVLLSVKVLDNGNVGEVTVKKTSGYPILDRAAERAVETWRFHPASRGGTPCDMWVDVPVHFVIQESN